VARVLMKWYAAGAGMLRSPRTTKAFFEEAMLSAASPPIMEYSPDHTEEACWRCNDVRSISFRDLLEFVLMMFREGAGWIAHAREA
jgi:hypothetical protein